jgi:hypothetical protein
LEIKLETSGKKVNKVEKKLEDVLEEVVQQDNDER